MTSITEMVKNKKVTFLFFKEGELWYTTECGFNFPVPIDDVGTAAMIAEDTAILFMRWIRKELAVQEELAEQLKKSKITEKHNIFNDQLK